jgi:tetratricopeptide (TPR) repeat protein
MGEQSTLIGFVSGGDDFGDIPTADVIGGRYEIQGVLGTGATGVVYKVRDLDLEETVALKRLRPGLGSDAIARFRREVRLSRKITHSNVVRIHDLGEVDGAPYLTMEWIDGASLRRFLEDGAVPAAALPHWCAQLFAGVQAAHDAGVVHCDLKPDNVLVSLDGRVAVADFGIAQAAAGASGGFAGTPGYMAPEQAEGAATTATDQYALGALLFELVTGTPPWPGARPADVARRSTAPVPRVRERCGSVPEAIAAAIERALHPDPRHRHATVADFAAALGGDGVAQPRSNQAARVRQLPRSNALAVVVGDVRPCPGSTELVEPIADALTERLATSGDLRVRPRTAWRSQTDAPALSRALALGATALVEGHTQRDGDQLTLWLGVVGLPDGYQVWRGRVTGPASQALVLAEQAAEAVAEALAAVLPPSAGRATRPEAVARYLSLRALARNTWSQDANEGLEACRQALADFPNEPLLLALFAQFAAAHRFQDAAPAGLIAEGRRAATQALALAPTLGEAWFALARLAWFEGQYAETYTALKTTLTHTPGHSRAQEMMGALLLEIGDLQAGIDHLEAARSLDPTSDAAEGDLLRAWALQGAWDRVDERLTDLTPSPETASRILMLARLTMWRGGAGPRLPEWPRGEGDGSGRNLFDTYVPLAVAVQRGLQPTAADIQRLSEANLRYGNLRMRMLAMQIEVEALSRFAPDLAFTRLGALVAEPFLDRNWMRLCPALHPLRERAGFAELVATVEARGAALLG